jgi:hypothetical protein
VPSGYGWPAKLVPGQVGLPIVASSCGGTPPDCSVHVAFPSGASLTASGPARKGTRWDWVYSFTVPSGAGTTGNAHISVVCTNYTLTHNVPMAES